MDVDLPPFFVASANFAMTLGFVGAHVVAASDIVQCNGVGLVSLFDGPFFVHRRFSL